jgi:topoisomerase-4 subunit A
MIGRDGWPRCKPLTEILLEWIEFRIATVRRRSQFRLQKVEGRIHILEGRQAVLLAIDRVIKLIRGSDDPKPDLMKAFKLSERQAEDILEIRLRQLARLEGIRIEQELAELRKDEAALGKLLGATPHCPPGREEIEDDAKKYGGQGSAPDADPRGRARRSSEIADEPVTVIVSDMGLCARGPADLDTAQFGFKTGDALHASFAPHRQLACHIGSNGRVIRCRSRSCRRRAATARW